MKKKTAVLLYPQFSEYELSVALSILMQGKKTIVTIGLNNQPIIGESGLSVVPDKTVDEVNFDELDSLLLTGCMDILALENHEKYINFIRDVVTDETIIASISSSPYLLAKAGYLKEKKYTVGMTPENREESGVFERENYSDELVVKDGNVITARGRGFIRFGIYFGNALNLDFDEDWFKE
ncbi:DJ-1/PfpI family protein [Shimazuella kribbensis]|uniref:DJ-1/PfpI family protein n=1 Tax=Shimazuella kribbensis TaxID=139808 RepID=UPI000414CDE5|nr:DJ-1/PfpI family protein [Shimazuella kribbensis]